LSPETQPNPNPTTTNSCSMEQLGALLRGSQKLYFLLVILFWRILLPKFQQTMFLQFEFATPWWFYQFGT